MADPIPRSIQELARFSSPILLDVSHFPLLYIAYPKPFSGEQWRDFVDAFNVLLDAKTPFGWINDARTANLPTAHDRTLLAEHHRARSADYRAYAKGAATVAKSAMVRGIITAIQWIHPAPFAHASVATPEEAEVFVREKLGMPVHPSALIFAMRTIKRAG